MWAAAFRAPPEGDEVAIDGNHYLTRFGVDPGKWPGPALQRQGQMRRAESGGWPPGCH